MNQNRESRASGAFVVKVLCNQLFLTFRSNKSEIHFFKNKFLKLSKMKRSLGDITDRSRVAVIDRYPSGLVHLVTIPAVELSCCL